MQYDKFPTGPQCSPIRVSLSFSFLVVLFNLLRDDQYSQFQFLIVILSYFSPLDNSLVLTFHLSCLKLQD